MDEIRKRRVRYSGTHPKKYNEKYKELNPDKYQDTINKVISKGSTPAGMHISIMVEEILNFFDIKENQCGLDLTLGYGGHTIQMLKKLNHSGHMYAIDADPSEFIKTTKRIEEKGYKNLTAINMNFGNIKELLNRNVKFDFILADLGVSSMQIDDPKRGFSYKHDTELDLRLDQTKGITAKQRLKNISVEELEGMLIENSDEPYANIIAQEIVNTKFLESTKQLREVIENALTKHVKKIDKDLIKKTCQRVFQAIRIDINEEYEVLYEMLETLPMLLKDGGKVAILTFHSGEDRLVKKAFKRDFKQGYYSEINDEILTPSKEECYNNPRAKSTKMRYAIK